MGRRVNVLCLFTTVVVTLATTVVVGIAVLSDYWEVVQYSSEEIGRLLGGGDEGRRIEVLFDGKVVVIKNASWSQEDEAGDGDEAAEEVLVQMHGGLWKVCLDLTDDELEELDSMYPNVTGGGGKCYNQLEEQETFLKTTPRAINSRQIRMQNLSISCSVVCLIILVGCLLIFWVGLIERQVPPVLVVSVLYLLAGVFAVFSLSIARYRRQPASLDCGPLDSRVSARLLPSRSFHPSWSVHLGWVGVGCCGLSALCVYTLSKLMRNPPFVL